MKITNNDTKQHILDIGYQLIAQKGFTAVGLAEILSTAKIPKGSFYHYFKSKEQFGEVMIEQYFQQYLTQLKQLFSDDSQTGYQRIMNYWQQWLNTQATSCADNKCLVVKLSAEVADLSEPMRLALLNGSQKVTQAIAQCLHHGKTDLSIAVEEPELLANMLYTMWLGASLVSKLQQNQTPLKLAMLNTEKLLANAKNV